MKRAKLFAIALLGLGLVTVSCTKEEQRNGNSPIFKASVENNAKVSFNETDNLTWDDNESVKIYGQNNSILYHAENINGQYCDLVPDDGQGVLGDGPYTAILPSGIAESSTSICLNKEQQSENGELSGNPMIAQSNRTVLSFKNLCSVVKIHMQKSNTSITKLQLITDRYMNGDFTVDYNGGDPTLTYQEGSNNHTKVTTLTLHNAQDISNGHDFYIYLPAGTYNYFQIKVYDNTGCICTRTTTSGLTFERSKYHNITIPTSAINFYPGDLTGKFTVSSDGRKVSFSKGNLQQNGIIYQFANYQYNKQDENYTYLFQWSADDNASTTYNERGNNNIVNGGGSTWRTLTGSEWDYLLRLRNETAKWNLVKIDRINGVIIYPDNFVWPLEDNAAPAYNQNPSSDYGTKSFTLAEWRVLEDAGCVFLPATGHISGNSTSVSSTDYGYYWSSTAVGTDFNTGSYARVFYFQPRSLAFPGSSNAHRENKTSYSAIRLVKVVQ